MKQVEKLRELVQMVDALENAVCTPEEFEEEFRVVFDGDYDLMTSSEDDDDYYEWFTNEYFLEELGGVKIIVESGKGDLFGNEHSHDGIDITIKSETSKNSALAEGITMVEENTIKVLGYTFAELVNKIILENTPDEEKEEVTLKVLGSIIALEDVKDELFDEWMGEFEDESNGEDASEVILLKNDEVLKVFNSSLDWGENLGAAIAYIESNNL